MPRYVQYWMDRLLKRPRWVWWDYDVGSWSVTGVQRSTAIEASLNVGTEYRIAWFQTWGEELFERPASPPTALTTPEPEPETATSIMGELYGRGTEATTGDGKDSPANLTVLYKAIKLTYASGPKICTIRRYHTTNI